MIERYLTQSTIWKHRTGVSASGSAVYASDVLIACRWEWKRRLVRNQVGEEVVSEGRIFLTGAVAVGDQLMDPNGRSWTVLAVTPHYGLGGHEAYREASI